MLDVEIEKELLDEVDICIATEVVAGKPTTVITERLLLVPELKETPMKELLEIKNWLQINKM